MDSPRPLPLFRGLVTDQGELRMRDLPRWRGALARLRGKDITIQIRKENQRRSVNQNAYYWGVVLVCASEWSGHEAEELHEAFKARFLPKQQRILPTGEVLEIPSSTARLDIEQFSAYVSKVILFLAESGVAVPSSEEVA